LLPKPHLAQVDNTKPMPPNPSFPTAPTQIKTA